MTQLSCAPIDVIPGHFLVEDIPLPEAMIGGYRYQYCQLPNRNVLFVDQYKSHAYFDLPSAEKNLAYFVVMSQEGGKWCATNYGNISSNKTIKPQETPLKAATKFEEFMHNLETSGSLVQRNGIVLKYTQFVECGSWSDGRIDITMEMLGFQNYQAASADSVGPLGDYMDYTSE
ncbi:MAG UNVERIFIED_CONTAM: hypothetical protein LVQ98_02990 [Rickettsiaceae bacterium]|jgi:hypothetical protein